MEQTEKRRPTRRLLLTLALTAALVTAYTALCAWPVCGVYPNVTALGVPLEGMDRGEVRAALARTLEEAPLPSGRGVVFRAENRAGESRVVSLPLAAAVVDERETAARAWALGRALPFPLRGGALLRYVFAGAEVPPVYRAGPEMTGELDRVDGALGKPVTQTRWQAGETALTIAKGIPGALLDREKLVPAILERMSRGEVISLAGAPRPQFTVGFPETLPRDPDWTAVLRRVERPVRNAVFDPARKRFQTDRPGVTFDPAAAEAAYAAMDWGETSFLPLTVTAPETTLTDLEPLLFRDVLGTCTTSIAGSADRAHNVALAAGFFDGTVLLPGETFSYNDTVGSRTARRGFLPAPVYVSGQTVRETGGGVCQGSSTLYLAALRADLEIVERHNHGFVPRYVPDGMDATVYYGVKDLKLRNDTPFPIRISGSVAGRALTVSILGTRTENITVELTSRTLGTTPFRTVYRLASGLPAGVTRTAVTPYTGCTVEVFRNRYRDGSLIESRLESTSVYRSRDKVVLVSPADRRKYGL